MGGRAGGRAGEWEKALVVSCHALMSGVFCRVRVFPAFGTAGLGDRYCVRPDEMAWAGQGRAGQHSLVGPESSPKDCDTEAWGERLDGC